MTPELEQRLQQIVSSDRVVLFMKGTREQPQCGFSAQMVQILDRLLPAYGTVNVLADPEIRDGIKLFSDWPTIPQLYVGGEFQGGCDIVREMYETGELHRVLELEPVQPGGVEIIITDAALEILEQGRSRYGGGDLHLGIDARYRHSLGFGPPDPAAVQVEVNGLTVFLDRDSAARARGVIIDAEETPSGPRLRIENPHATAPVPQLSVHQYKELRDQGATHRLIDVRTPAEREAAAIEGSRLFDESVAGELEMLSRDTMLVFYCHSGGRSQAAAEQYVRLGFTRVYNLAGGIAAWSQHVDTSLRPQ